MSELKSFADVRAALKQFIPTPKQYEQARFSLEDMKRLLDYLDNPQDKLKVIHVAGTSGKTSTCYYVSALLKAAGQKVGLTVSPHVDEVNERVQLNLEPLPEEKFCREFSAFIKLVESSGIKPSYFAVIVAFAYWLFAKEKVDYAVIEVGMGGVLDATNVVNRADKICVITDIDLDHTEFLGNTLAEIASQKAGIIQPRNVVFSYDQGREVMDVIRQVGSQQQAKLHEPQPPESQELPQNLPLFQRCNWYLALSVYDFASKRDGLTELDEKQQARATETYVPARMETLEQKGKIIIMDGAHNAQKLEALAKSIKARYPGKKVSVLFGQAVTGGERNRGSVAAVTKLADHMIVASFSGEQDVPKVSVRPAKIAEYCRELGFDNWEIVEEPEKALQALLKRPEEVLLITGSFYLLNHIRPHLLRGKVDV